MKQSRGTSFFKSLISTVVGFAVAMVANAAVLPVFGYTPTLSENVALTTIYTVISIARGYALERLFEALGWRMRMSAFALSVVAELHRQRTVEGWTTEHDDAHEPGELARAGAAYLYAGSITDPVQRQNLPQAWRADGRGSAIIRELWDWTWEFWKPKPDDRRRDLVRGCALGIAEGEKFDRNRKRKVDSALSHAPTRGEGG